MYNYSDIINVKNKSGHCIHTFIWESRAVAFKHFKVSPGACAINFHLEHSFYIEMNKNIICYFNTLKMFFVILLPISCILKK